MSRRSAWLVGLVVLAALAGGCATKYEGAFNPALFPRVPAAAESRAPGRVALLVQPPVQGQVHEGVKNPATGVRLPVGQIVEQALLAAALDALRGGVERVPQVPPAGAGFDATLVIEAVRADHHSQLSWLIPIPVYPFLIGDTNFYAQLAFDLSLLDAAGRTVWTRTYDSGREIYKRPSFWSNEKLPDGFLRMAHEAAWRLSQQAMTDLRDWLAVERRKPREL